ncbi:hypothetical protein D9613_011493 [Agrocybe pediades]|uniref:Aminopeptidase P N-terminal domain-containing protein n=1 Tax=Agrocybe pediades TaxID=84607 RepID=A0A8H4QRR9_9AGAR|nr:hypothetical protein D9613_011493 [Agrocybe pediades]
MFHSVRRAGAARFSTRNIATKPSQHGQPTITSHPHLIRRHDLTPGIPSSEYEQRRRKLMDLLPEKSIAIAVSTPVKYMSGKIFYKYRPASDMWYLTGFEEPDSAVVLQKDSSSKGYKMTLFCAGTDMSKAKWNGATTSLSAAKEIFQADDTLPIENFGSHVKSLLSSASLVYVDLPNPAPWNPKTSYKKPRSLLKYLSGSSSTEQEDVVDSISGSMRRPLAPQMGKLRSIKSKAEQRVMRQAADISGRAHAKVMRFAQPGMLEAKLEAHFEYICALEGAKRLAYVPVVASGPNALILHYTHNNQIIEKDELVLIDAGCEYDAVATRLILATRTFPASGTFTPAQRELYSAVLSVQKQLIELCTASQGYSSQELHRKSCSLLKQELNQIGFNLGTEGDLERVLYPHYFGHPIGIGELRSLVFFALRQFLVLDILNGGLINSMIDLHESAHVDRSSPLKEGMVITIEPGIYVPPTPNFPTHFHNIGIRIEDEVLVQDKHAVVLSVSAPKEIADIEGACQGLLGLEPY